MSLLLLTLASLCWGMTPAAELETATSFNTLGARVNGTVGLEQTFWSEREHELFGDSGARAGIDLSLSPSYLRVGPSISIAPLAIWEVEAHAVISPYFGTFSSLVGFDGPEALYSEAVLDQAAEEGRRTKGLITQFGFKNSFRMKFGPLITVAEGEWEFWWLHDNQGLTEEYYFEPESKLLLARTDQTTCWDLAALIDTPGLRGGRSLYLGVLTTDEWARQSGDRNLRVGPMAVLRLNEGLTEHLLLVQAWAENRVLRSFPPYIAIRSRYQFK
jgi:hypothetical protein